MEQMISKKEFDELIKLKGEVRGVGLKDIGQFILKEEGEEGLNKLEDVITKLGYEIKYRKLRSMDFYPVGLIGISLAVIKNLFNYDDKRFREIGDFHVKTSAMLRLFTKYLISFEKLLKEVPRMWRMYFTVGDLMVIESKEEEKYIKLRLKDFPLHPFHCQFLIGYFPSMLQIVVKSKTTCKKTKSPEKDFDYYEFLLKW